MGMGDDEISQLYLIDSTDHGQSILAISSLSTSILVSLCLEVLPFGKWNLL